MAGTATVSTAVDEARAIGAALQKLRERAGLSQEDLAERLNVARQTISRYEAGRTVVLRLDVQQAFLHGVGASVADLVMARDNVVHPDFEGRRGGGGGDGPAPLPFRTVVPVQTLPEVGEDGAIHYVDVPPTATEDLGWLFTPNAGFLRLVDGAFPEGAVLARFAGYDKTAWPRRGQGCVIETRDGELLPALYERKTEAGYLVRTGDDDAAVIALGRVKGVYAIRFWGD